MSSGTERLIAMRRNRSLATAIIAGSAVVAIACGVAVWWLAEGPGAGWMAALGSAELIVETIRGFGAWAFAASVGLMALHTFVPFPAEFLAIANGVVFGVWLGILATWTGAMIGGIVGFALARYLGHPFVQGFVGAPRWRQIEAWTAGYGTGALLLSRLTPVISFNLVNFAAGLAGVGWWTFLWTMALGILPATIVAVLVGSSLLVAPWPLWVALAIAVVGVSVFFWRRYSRPDATVARTPPA